MCNKIHIELSALVHSTRHQDMEGVDERSNELLPEKKENALSTQGLAPQILKPTSVLLHHREALLGLIMTQGSLKEVPPNYMIVVGISSPPYSAEKKV